MPEEQTSTNDSRPEEGTNRQASDVSPELSTLNSRVESHTNVPRYYSANERTPLLRSDTTSLQRVNLQSVRALKIALWVLVALTSLWVLLLLINCFTSISFMPSRSSGFLEFDLALLSLISLLLSLLVFPVFSELEQVLGYAVVACLALQLVMVLALPHIRHFYSPVGLFSFFWAFLVMGMCLVVYPRAVKKEQDYVEERLTGRQEDRRTFMEWVKVSLSMILLLIVILLPVLLFFCGLLLDIYDTARLYHGDGAAAKGIFVPISYSDTRDYSVFIECTNDHDTTIDNSAPIVLLEADDTTSAQILYSGWLEELYETNKVSKVCLWNRPGRAFSDVAPSPFSLSEASDALTIALERAISQSSASSTTDPDAPFQNRTLALVSHGLGGLYSRYFASRHIHSVQSIFLIDTLQEESLHDSIGLLSRGFKLWLNGLTTPLAIRRQLSWLVHHKGPESRFLSGGRMGSDSTVLKDGRLASSTNPAEIKASLQEQISAFNGQTWTKIQEANIILEESKIPLAVVSSAQTIRKHKEWSALQRKLTKVTSNNVAWEILDGPHEVWADEKAKYQLQTLFLNILEEKRRDLQS